MSSRTRLLHPQLHPQRDRFAQHNRRAPRSARAPVSPDTAGFNSDITCANDRICLMVPANAVQASISRCAIAVKRFSAASFASRPTHPAGHAANPSLTQPLRLVDPSGYFEIIIEPLDVRDLPALRVDARHGKMWLVIGDESQLETFNLFQSYANLVQLEIDLHAPRVRVSSSMIGLPPVFILRSARGTAIAAPFRPDCAHGLALGPIDVEATADVLRWGHPIANRTLAANLRLAPVNSILELS